MLRVTFKDNTYDDWNDELFDRFKTQYNSSYCHFIIIKDNNQIAIYNMESVLKITDLTDQSLIHTHGIPRNPL